MALPVLDKVWDFSRVNQYQATTADRHDGYRKQLRAIKDQLKTWGWTVKGCCGYWHGTTWTYDYSGTDYWDVDNAVQWGGDTYSQNWSWIILTKANAGGPGKNLELMFLCDGGVWDGVHLGNVSVSFQGFTGGTVRVSPSAPDMQYIHKNWCYGGRSSALWMTYSNGGDMYSGAERFESVTHYMRSNDDDVERIIVCVNNTVCLWFAFEKAKTPSSNWTHPCFVAWLSYNNCGGMGSGTPNYAGLNDVGNYFAYHNGRWTNIYMSSEGYGGATLGENVPYRNEISGENLMTPVTAISTTYGMRGRYGQLYDQWWTTAHASTYYANADTYPDDETRQFLTLGHAVIPWDGSVPLIM